MRKSVDKKKLQKDVARVLQTRGIDMTDRHFRGTPRHIAESLIEQTRGMEIDERCGMSW